MSPEGAVKTISIPSFRASVASVNIRQNFSKKSEELPRPIYAFCALHSRLASGTLAGFNVHQRSPMRSIICAALVAGSLLSVPPAFAQSQKQRGEYLVTIMDCTGCHTPGTFLGKPDLQRPLAGSEVGFQIPGAGIFYPPNLTLIPRRGSGDGARPISSRRCGPASGRTVASLCQSCRITRTPSSRMGMPGLWPAISRA
jgi:cytochrome c2